MPKKILIATKFFYPDITPRAFRAFELAKEFARQGHNVTVLTTKRTFNYTEIENKYGFKVDDCVKNEPAQLAGNSFFIRAIRFSLTHFFLFPFSLLAKYFSDALEREKGYDLIISNAHPYPVHFAVALAKKKNPALCKTWIADCGDPFVGNKASRLPVPFYFHFLENWFCNKPDYITIPIEEAKPAYPASCHHKIKVIPQGFDFSEVVPSYVPGTNTQPTFAYAGSLSPELRDPRPFLNLLDQSDTNFKFIVYTNNKHFLLPYVDKLAGKLELRDYIPRKQLLQELGQMDFLVNFENKNDVQRPSKLIDYALLERPILSLKPFSVDADIVSKFLGGNYENRLVISNIEESNIQNVATDFIKLTCSNIL